MVRPVVRNEMWQLLHSDILQTEKLTVGTDFTKKLTDSIWRAKLRYAELKKEKENKRIQIINATVKTDQKPPISTKCKAKNMNGKHCSFKASCGDYCKKHSKKN